MSAGTGVNLSHAQIPIHTRTLKKKKMCCGCKNMQQVDGKQVSLQRIALRLITQTMTEKIIDDDDDGADDPDCDADDDEEDSDDSTEDYDDSD